MADFSAGTTGADTYVSETGNGEVILTPTVGAEFSGGPGAALRLVEPALGSRAARRRAARRSRAASSHVDGAARRHRPPPTAPGARSSSRRPSAARASSTSASPTTSTSAWAIFSIKGDGQLNARTNNGASSDRHAASWRAGRHPAPLPDRVGRERGPVLRRRQPGRHPLGRTSAPPRCARPPATSTPAAPTLSVDWLHLSPYPAAGTLRLAGPRRRPAGRLGRRSAGPPTPPPAPAWRSASAPANTPTPDGSWSGFTPIAASGGDVAGNSRYLQYRAELSTSDPGNTPSLERGDGRATRPARTPRRPRSSSAAPLRTPPASTPAANVAAQFSEPMDPSTIDSSSFRLRAQGAGSDVPAAVTYSGATATLNPNADLAPGHRLPRHGRRLGRRTPTATRSGPTTPGASRRKLASLTDTTHRRLRRRDHRRRHLRLRDRQRRGHPERRPWARSSPADRRSRPAGRARTWESQGGGAGGSATVVGGALTSTAPSPSTDQTYGSGPRARVRGDLRRRELRARRLRRQLQQQPQLGDVQHQGRWHVLRPHQLRRGPDRDAASLERWSAARTATGSSGTRTRSATSSTAAWSPPTRPTSAPPRCDAGRQRLQRRRPRASRSTGCA